MEVIYILLPLAVLLAAGALYAFVRAASAGQFDDLQTPPHRMLHDDEIDVPPAANRAASMKHEATKKHDSTQRAGDPRVGATGATGA